MRSTQPPGRPSIAPEETLRALLLQVFCPGWPRGACWSSRPLLRTSRFAVFVGLGMDDAVWNHAVFSKKPRSVAELGCGPSVSLAEVNKQAKKFISWTSTLP